jgi:hypothetical protein
MGLLDTSNAVTIHRGTPWWVEMERVFPNLPPIPSDCSEVVVERYQFGPIFEPDEPFTPCNVFEEFRFTIQTSGQRRRWYERLQVGSYVSDGNGSTRLVMRDLWGAVLGA